MVKLERDPIPGSTMWTMLVLEPPSLAMVRTATLVGMLKRDDVASQSMEGAETGASARALSIEGVADWGRFLNETWESSRFGLRGDSRAKATDSAVDPESASGAGLSSEVLLRARATRREADPRLTWETDDLRAFDPCKANSRSDDNDSGSNGGSSDCREGWRFDEVDMVRESNAGSFVGPGGREIMPVEG